MSYGSIHVGFRFNPTDLEIIRCYLYPKVYQGTVTFIDEMDVYGHEPWLLPHKENTLFKTYEWFYLVRRTRGPGKNINGKRPRRTVSGNENGGTWKATDGETRIYDENNNTVGHKQSLTFFAKEKGKKNMTKTDWIMKEYRLVSTTFQEWVLCRIRYKPKQKSLAIQGPAPVVITEGIVPGVYLEDTRRNADVQATTSRSIFSEPYGYMMGSNREEVCSNRENREFSSCLGSTIVDRPDMYSDVFHQQDLDCLAPGPAAIAVDGTAATLVHSEDMGRNVDFKVTAGGSIYSEYCGAIMGNDAEELRPHQENGEFSSVMESTVVNGPNMCSDVFSQQDLDCLASGPATIAADGTAATIVHSEDTGRSAEGQVTAGGSVYSEYCGAIMDTDGEELCPHQENGEFSSIMASTVFDGPDLCGYVFGEQDLDWPASDLEATSADGTTFEDLLNSSMMPFNHSMYRCHSVV